MPFLKPATTPKGRLREAQKEAKALLEILDTLDLTETPDSDGIALDSETTDKITQHGERIKTCTRCSFF